MSKIQPSIAKKRGFSLGQIILVVVLVFGVYIRLEEYFSNRSIWLDEASLALNVIGKSFYGLLTQPLEYNQAAPVGFLLLTKLMVSLFGKSEFVFRFIPLVSSFISFSLLYRLSAKCFSRDFAVIPLFLLATSAEMVRYATEFKQYSSDVLCALIIALYSVSFLGKKYTRKGGFIFGAIGAVIIWFSFPSVFILGGVGLALLLSFSSERKWEDLKNLFISLLCWGVSFIVNYFLFLRGIAANISLENYWAYSFAPLPPFSIEEQFWFTDVFMRLFYHPGMVHQALIGLVLSVIGACVICKNQKTKFLVLFLPFLLCLLASSARKYPFVGRSLLFYVPFLYLFMTGGVEGLLNSRSYFLKGLGAVFLVFIIGPASTMASVEFSREVVYREDIKPVLNYVKTQNQKEDMIYVYYGADRAFQYYLDSYGFKNENYIKGINSRKDPEKYKKDLDQFKGKKRAWFIFAHVYSALKGSEEKQMVDYLESIGEREDSFRATGASVYLYDFTNHSNRDLPNET